MTISDLRPTGHGPFVPRWAARGEKWRSLHRGVGSGPTGERPTTGRKRCTSGAPVGERATVAARAGAVTAQRVARPQGDPRGGGEGGGGFVVDHQIGDQPAAQPRDLVLPCDDADPGAHLLQLGQVRAARPLVTGKPTGTATLSRDPGVTRPRLGPPFPKGTASAHATSALDAVTRCLAPSPPSEASPCTRWLQATRPPTCPCELGTAGTVPIARGCPCSPARDGGGHRRRCGVRPPGAARWVAGTESRSHTKALPTGPRIE
ncbi:hypothetical protein NORO109296_11685 [Nocardiopsis rhodophaea]